MVVRLSVLADALQPEVLDPSGIGRAVDARLAGFLEAKRLAAVEGGFPAEVVDVLEGLALSGGKRIRPLLSVVGWQAAGGLGDRRPVLGAAAALEMFHVFALIHDDVMDASPTRRGRPSVHEALTARYQDRPDPARLGASAAILVGDLAMAWSDELLHTAGLTSAQLTAALSVVAAMRTELMYGQYLDLLATGRPTADSTAALRIARFKSAKYTIERPLHLGAVLAGAGEDLCSALTAFAVPLGEAFQLRDDLLGVFGDPACTGKPALSDLREGKHTVLVALALQGATGTDRRLLETLLGDSDLDIEGAARICGVLESSGARAAVEELIASRHRQALQALDACGLPAAAAAALRSIASAATERTA
ncbi:polyprenyl synthetase family protein [Streptomyces sp. NPDC059552]|uniref:polyprenyl synthetase family protein n=1 Tax=Streptomyces sp. NPDC059552 TaxID=3346862 RepID=UPI0036CA6C0D